MIGETVTKFGKSLGIVWLVTFLLQKELILGSSGADWGTSERSGVILMNSRHGSSKACVTADQEGDKPSALRWSGLRKHTLCTCASQWKPNEQMLWGTGLMGNNSSFSKGTLTFHGWQQRYLPEQFRPGQTVYLWKRYNTSCLLHKVARQQPEKHPKKILSDTYKVLFVLCSGTFALLPIFLLSSNQHFLTAQWTGMSVTAVFLPQNCTYSVFDIVSRAVSNYWWLW